MSLYYGKRIESDETCSIQKSATPFAYTEKFIQISEEEYNALLLQIQKKIKEKKK